MRFAGLSYQLHNVSYPSYDAVGVLPQVQHDGRLIGSRKAMKYLIRVARKTTRPRVIDNDLKPEEKAEAVALAAMIQDTLRNALVRCCGLCVCVAPAAVT